MIKIPTSYNSLRFLRPVSWPEIFASWRKDEAHQNSWKKHWTERGFPSWKEWRRAYAAPLAPETLAWELYEMADPLRDIRRFYGVPSRGWIDKTYAGNKTELLSKIISHPIVKENEKITGIKNDFPHKTILTGIIAGDKLVLVEGMHRALALATWDKGKLFNERVIIALAEWKEDIPILGGNIYKQA